jgi:stage II sporulation protein E
MIDKAQLTAFYPHLGKARTNHKAINFKMKTERLLMANTLFTGILGFILGRAVILGGISPFGLAFMSAAAGTKARLGPAALGVMIGSLTVNGGVQYIRYFLTVLLFSAVFMMLKNRISSNMLLISALMCESALVSGLIVIYLNGFTLYDSLVVVFESVLILITANVFYMAMSEKRTGNVTAELGASFVLLSGAALAGLSDVYLAGVSVRGVLGTAMIMTGGYLGGAGAGCAAGASLGLIYSLATLNSPMMVGVLCFAGMISGLFKPAGKLGSAVGYAAGGFVMNYYINHLAEAYLSCPEVLLGAVVFLAIPKKALQKLTTPQASMSSQGFEERVRRLTSCRLKEVSTVLSELSGVFSQAVTQDNAREDSNLSQVYDELGKKVCKTCHMRRTCWEKDFYRTYQNVFEVMAIAESRGRLTNQDVPELFKRRCVRLREFISFINKAVTVLKSNGYWNKRLMESRALVAEQLEGVSKIIDELSEDVKSDVVFRHDLEGRVIQALLKENVPVVDVMAMELPGGHLEVTVEKRGCMGRRECASCVLPSISSEIGRKMVFKNTSCSLRTGKQTCVLSAVQAQNYEVAVGCAAQNKSGSMVSGDTFVFNHLRDGKYMLALSDGMGSGQNAADESRAAISLLEKLLETGFSHDVAVHTINSALMLKSRDETFATLDLMVLDLYGGQAEFVKVGACPSIVKTADRIETIRASNLPVGIVENVDVEPIRHKLSPGDIVVMFSDGLLDSLKDRVQDPEHFIIQCLASINTKNPQELVETLMKTVLDKVQGNAKDDVTILAAKVWERTAA